MGRPDPSLSVPDAVCLLIGVVVGVGVFRAPAVIAGNVASEWQFILVWMTGAVISLFGALCYAEMASSHPDVGGEYHFLRRAYGRSAGFLFAWGRLSVIQTGAIAAVAFVLGDYASQILPLGSHGPAIYAAISITALTALNAAGLSGAKWLQNVLTMTTILTIVVLIAAGLLIEPTQPGKIQQQAPPGESGAIGLAMIFVLLTFGGWNEAVYLSAEVRDVRKNIARVLLIGLVVIAVTYVLLNLAYLNVLGLEGMRGSDVVAADLLRRTMGDRGALIISMIITAATLTTLNATIFTGARGSYALGRDFRIFSLLGRWDGSAKVPTSALLVQGGVSLLLVLIGAITREGFTTMVEYTAPAFWLFFTLTSLAVFVLRYREPGAFRPFKVPFYPFTPALFCMACAYMLHASVVYTGVGALLSVAVISAGIPLFLLATRMDSASHQAGGSLAGNDSQDA